MAPKILIITPTRARPENLERLRASLLAQSEDFNSFDLVACIDTNDPKLVDYLVDAQTPGRYYVTGEPKRLGPWLNEVVKIVHPDDYDIIGFLGDDVEARTHGWDKRVREAMQPDGMVYCNDGWQGQGLPTGIFMDTTMIVKAGYMVYPELTHLYIDNHWKAWGEALGTLTYLDDVLLEHMHPFAGKAKTDAVYDAANSPDMYSKDGQTFEKFVKTELSELVKRIG